MTDAPRPDLDDAERRVRSWTQPPVVFGMQRALIRLLDEYDRRGAALAERDAEIARLRAGLERIADDLWSVGTTDAQLDLVSRLRALAAAPTPTEETGDA